jgi:hypothetical protein
MPNNIYKIKAIKTNKVKYKINLHKIRTNTKNKMRNKAHNKDKIFIKHTYNKHPT